MQLVERPKDGSDLDVRVIAAYLNQCTAEAQGGWLTELMLCSLDSFLRIYPHSNIHAINATGRKGFVVSK